MSNVIIKFEKCITQYQVQRVIDRMMFEVNAASVDDWLNTYERDIPELYSDFIYSIQRQGLDVSNNVVIVGEDKKRINALVPRLIDYIQNL